MQIHKPLMYRNDDSSIPEPVPSVDDATRDVREHAAEALRMLQEHEAQEGDTADGESIDNQTTYDLKDAAAEAMRMQQQKTTIIYPRKKEADGDKADENASGTDVFGNEQVLHLILAEDETYILDPTQDMIVGRSDKVTDYTPDVDLTQYGAYRLGLSRQHALLRRNGQALELVDLGSRNGTHINDKRLEPKQAKRLRDGDRVRLGNLAFRVAFQPR